MVLETNGYVMTTIERPTYLVTLTSVHGIVILVDFITNNNSCFVLTNRNTVIWYINTLSNDKGK